MSSTFPAPPAAATLNLSTIAEALDKTACPLDTFDPLPLKPWMDLATLALLAHSGELRAERRACAEAPQRLSERTLSRLEALAGDRPEHYWGDLVYYGATLGLFEAQQGKWVIRSVDSEILGATRRECFPALCAAWLKSTAPIPELCEVGLSPDCSLAFKMDVMRFITQLDEGRWYPYSSLGFVLKAAAQKHGVELSPESLAAMASALTERVFLVLGAVSINAAGDHFIARNELQVPAATIASRCSERADAQGYRQVVARQFEKDQSWRRVATGLWRCLEVRRERRAPPASLRCTDADNHLETDPRLPFRDCLFLARIGRLVPLSEGASRDSDRAFGRYAFELAPDTLKRSITEGLPAAEIAAFLRERCCDESFGKIQRMLQAATGQ